MAIEAVACTAGLPGLVGAILGSGAGGTNGITLWAAVGTGTGVIAASNTIMFTEDTTTARVAVTLADNPSGTLNGQASFSFPSTNETLTEIAFFDSATHGAGNMYYHRAGFSTPVGPTAGVSALAFSENIPLTPVVTP